MAFEWTSNRLPRYAVPAVNHLRQRQTQIEAGQRAEFSGSLIWNVIAIHGIICSPDRA